MRVIAGSARGRKLRCFDDRRIRPTQDRVKEAVFSSIAPRLADASVLDLFAGSGALGIEALSRGAGSAVFVEIDHEACDLVKGNLTSCGWSLTPEIQVIHREAIRWLKTLKERNFDIIFADPPYKKGFEDSLLSALSAGDILSPDGILMLESDSGLILPESYGKLNLLKSKVYGDTKISYFVL